MRDAGRAMLDARCWMRDAGRAMLDARCWTRDAGCYRMGYFHSKKILSQAIIHSPTKV